VCNAWKEREPDAETTEAKENLDKWLFYFDRFNNHELSAKLDQELCERTDEKMLEVQETSQLSWIEVRFSRWAYSLVARS
jgi:ariadne-1